MCDCYIQSKMLLSQYADICTAGPVYFVGSILVTRRALSAKLVSPRRMSFLSIYKGTMRTHGQNMQKENAHF